MTEGGGVAVATGVSIGAGVVVGAGVDVGIESATASAVAAASIGVAVAGSDAETIAQTVDGTSTVGEGFEAVHPKTANPTIRGVIRILLDLCTDCNSAAYGIATSVSLFQHFSRCDISAKPPDSTEIAFSSVWIASMSDTLSSL